MPQACVVDTTILQKANAPILREPRASRQFVRRLRLLERLAKGELIVLISQRLLTEYEKQVAEPRNDKVKAFLEMLTSGSGRVLFNWKARWSGADREKARRCRFPAEDDHVLRTAVRPDGSTILSEEDRMMAADSCIYRAFSVLIVNPC